MDPIEYLSTRVLVDKIPVTYRTLSREAHIHVNQAKRYLYKFYSTHDDIHCTYLISGRRNDEDDEPLPLNQSFMLVGQQDIESAKEKFHTILSIHLYSVEPTELSNPCVLSGIDVDNANKFDLNQSVEFNSSTYGIILNEKIQDAANLYPGKIATVSATKQYDNKSTSKPSPLASAFTKAKPKESQDQVIEGDIEMHDDDDDDEKLKDIFKDDDIAELEDSHNQQAVSDSDEAAQVLPPPPQEEEEEAPPPPPGKRLRKVTKTITTQNEKGYLVSKTQDVWEQVSDDEQEQQPQTVKKEVKSSLKPASKPKPKPKQQSTNQSSLMGFLKKKK